VFIASAPDEVWAFTIACGASSQAVGSSVFSSHSAFRYVAP
jgi:hypothetical protein